MPLAIARDVSPRFGLMLYNARWLRSVPVTQWRGYDPVNGRFTQADSIVPGGVQGLDRYAYVNNAPTRFTDPSGHREVEWTEDGGGFPLGGTSDDGLNLGGGNSFTVTNMAMTPMLLNGELSYLQITRGWFSNWLSKYALQSVERTVAKSSLQMPYLPEKGVWFGHPTNN